MYVSVFAEVLPHFHVHVVARPPDLPADERGARLFLVEGRVSDEECATLFRRVSARLTAEPSRSPWPPVLLSALVWPGAGQIKNGERFKGALFGLASLALLAFFAWRVMLDAQSALLEARGPLGPLETLDPRRGGARPECRPTGLRDHPPDAPLGRVRPRRVAGSHPQDPRPLTGHDVPYNRLHTPGMTTQDAVHTIVRVVSPYVGETMARSATQAHCQKLGIGSDIGLEQLEALLSRLGSGLNIFLGREKASRVVDELRQAMAAGGPS